MSTTSSTSPSVGDGPPGRDVEASRGLLDTSVVIDHEGVDPARLPEQSSISAITVAELAAGPSATDDPLERSTRQDRLHWAVSRWDPVPFDVDAARAFGHVAALTRAAGRRRRNRLADLQIAAIAIAYDLELYTRNADDVEHLSPILRIVAL